MEHALGEAQNNKCQAVVEEMYSEEPYLAGQALHLCTSIFDARQRGGK